MMFRRTHSAASLSPARPSVAIQEINSSLSVSRLDTTGEYGNIRGASGRGSGREKRTWSVGTRTSFSGSRSESELILQNANWPLSSDDLRRRNARLHRQYSNECDHIGGFKQVRARRVIHLPGLSFSEQRRRSDRQTFTWTPRWGAPGMGNLCGWWDSGRMDRVKLGTGGMLARFDLIEGSTHHLGHRARTRPTRFHQAR
jgi:hypothetical protein